MPEGTIEAIVIMNRDAGALSEAASELEQAARALGLPILARDCLEGVPAGTCERRLRELTNGDVKRVIVAGGDGSIHRLVHQLAPDFPCELAIVPLGTGNDLARSLDLPLDPLKALQSATELPAKPIDLVRVDANSTSQWLCNTATGGFGAEVTGQTDPESKQRWGAAAYWLAALTHYLNLTEYRVTLRGDSQEYTETVYGVAIGNGCYAGGGFAVAPHALLDDGLVQVVMMPVLPTLDLVATSVEMSFAGELESDHLIQFSTQTLELRSEPPMPFSIDGELCTLSTASFAVEPRRVRISCGPQAAVRGTAASN